MSNKIKAVLIILGAAAVALLLGMLIGEQNLFGLAVVGASLIFLLFLPNPAWVGFLCVILYYSGLTAPGIPGKLNFFYLSAIGLIGIMFLQLGLKRLRKIQWSTSHTLVACFGAVLITTILVRGAGFRVLGSGTWGGMFYVQLLICMMLVVALPQAGIEPKWWPRAILLMALFSLLPLVSDTLILMGADPAIVWKVIQGSQQIGSSLAADVQVRQGVVRYFSAGVAAQLLLVGFFAVFNVNRLFTVRGIWLLPLPLVFLGLTFFSGFRLSILAFGLILLVIVYLQRGFTFARLGFGLFLAFAAWYTLIHTSAYLPAAAQRALSWVPGTDIPEYVRADATGTVDWRIELWQQGLKTLPNYWLVGKGYAFSEKEAVGVTGANAATDQIAWALVTSSYHNGPISLLLGLGVFGLLIGASLMIAVCGRHGRALRERWHDPGLRQCHQAVYAILFVHVVIFFTIYGDVQASFPPFLFQFALLEALRRADQSHAPSQAAAGAPGNAVEPMRRPRRRIRR